MVLPITFPNASEGLCWDQCDDDNGESFPFGAANISSTRVNFQASSNTCRIELDHRLCVNFETRIAIPNVWQGPSRVSEKHARDDVDASDPSVGHNDGPRYVA
jgi:hypothetical protein